MADDFRRSRTIAFTSKDVARILQMSESTIRNWRSKGRGPKWKKIEGGAVRYDPSDFWAWYDKQDFPKR